MRAITPQAPQPSSSLPTAQVRQPLLNEERIGEATLCLPANGFGGERRRQESARPTGLAALHLGMPTQTFPH